MQCREEQQAAAIAQRTASDAAAAGSQLVQSTGAQPPADGAVAVAATRQALELWQQQPWRATQDAAEKTWERLLQQAELDSAKATVFRRAGFDDWQRHADAAPRAGHPVTQRIAQ